MNVQVPACQEESRKLEDQMVEVEVFVVVWIETAWEVSLSQLRSSSLEPQVRFSCVLQQFACGPRDGIFILFNEVAAADLPPDSILLLTLLITISWFSIPHSNDLQKGLQY